MTVFEIKEGKNRSELAELSRVVCRDGGLDIVAREGEPIALQF
jgi:hypothetical protein